MLLSTGVSSLLGLLIKFFPVRNVFPGNERILTFAEIESVLIF